MATLKLERGGKKASLMNKFRVFIDGDHVGDLKKYGHSAVVEVPAGTHSVAVKAFGGVAGEAEIELGDGETLSLIVGYPSFVGGLIEGMGTGKSTLGLWERDS